MARIFIRLNFDVAKSNKPELLKKLDRLVMESSARSLLDMDVDEANRVISQNGSMHEAVRRFG